MSSSGREPANEPRVCTASFAVTERIEWENHVHEDVHEILWGYRGTLTVETDDGYSVQLPSGSTGNLIVTELGMAYPAGAQLENVGGYGYIALPLERLHEVFDGVTYALTFSQVDGSAYDGIQAIIDSDLFQSLEVAKSDSIYGMRTSVTDYRTAVDWINELTENVLAPLGE